MITSNLPVIRAGMMPDHLVGHEFHLDAHIPRQAGSHVDFKADQLAGLVFHRSRGRRVSMPTLSEPRLSTASMVLSLESFCCSSPARSRSGDPHQECGGGQQDGGAQYPCFHRCLLP